MNSGISQVFIYHVSQDRIQFLDDIRAGLPETFEGYRKHLIDEHIIYEKDTEVFLLKTSKKTIMEELSEKNSYLFQYRAYTSKGFQWFETVATVQERDGKNPKSILFCTRSLNLFLFEDGSEKSMVQMRQLVNDCFQGFGKIFFNIILIDINKGTYITYNPYGTDYADSQEIVPNGDYTNDNIGYGKNFIYESDQEMFWSHTTLEAYRERLKNPGDYYSFHIRHIKDGVFQWTEVFCVRLGTSDDDFRVLYWVANTDKQTREFQYDHLTGLYNKNYFYQFAGQIMNENPEIVYDVICADIDNFKLYNDNFGIQKGDHLLKNIGDLFRKNEKKLVACARFYADIFICLIEHKDAYTEKQLIDFDEKINANEDTGNVHVKWGIYQGTKEKISVAQMCDRAMLAAKKIKGKYGVSVVYYNEEISSQLREEQWVIDAMDAALKNGEFQIYLQPQYSGTGEKFCGAEALVRWVHPEKGKIMPDDFIRIFEKTGFITKLDWFVWEKVCELLRRWKHMGYGDFRISVNVSRADLFGKDFVKRLVQMVNQYEIHPSQLHLEVTETVYAKNADAIKYILTQLRESGFMIAMDDFGSGYSSLGILPEMPFDILKLDWQLIKNELKHPGSIQYMIGLAHWLRLQIVAEGIETEEQYACFKQLGCDYMQGFYLEKPMFWEDFERKYVIKMGRQDHENR